MTTSVPQRLQLLVVLLLEAWPVWAGVVMPLLAWWAAPYLLPGPKSIQYLGVAMEAFGVMVVAYELIEIREQLDSPGVLSIVRRWLNRFGQILRADAADVQPNPPRSEPVGEDHRHSASRASPPISEQIVAMMKIVDVMYRKLDTLQRLRTLEDRLANESQQATDQLQRLTSQLQTVSLGNIGREFVGASLIVLGLLFANLPDEFFSLWRVVMT